MKLQQELEQLAPIPDDELQQAAEIFETCSQHWHKTNGDRKDHEAHIQLIVARVWVKDYQVVVISLRPNYHIALGLESEKPATMNVGSLEDITDSDISIPDASSGDDPSLATLFCPEKPNISRWSGRCCQLLEPRQDKKSNYICGYATFSHSFLDTGLTTRMYLADSAHPRLFIDHPGDCKLPRFVVEDSLEWLSSWPQ